jgi:hypothetical protein
MPVLASARYSRTLTQYTDSLSGGLRIAPEDGLRSVGATRPMAALKTFRLFELGDWLPLAEAVAKFNAIPGQCVYFRASTVTTEDGCHTKDQNFAQSPGCWGDLDTKEHIERAKSVNTILRPNVFVITGCKPHMRTLAQRAATLRGGSAA